MVGAQSYEGADREGVWRSKPLLEPRPSGPGNQNGKGFQERLKACLKACFWSLNLLACVQAAQKEHCVGGVWILYQQKTLKE